MSRRITPLAGKKFGDLIVVGLDHHNARARTYYWRCWCCACGHFCVVLSSNLVNGKTTNCGCKPKNGTKTHGMRYTRLYTIYRDMRSRCENPNHMKYRYYGLRGIKVCQEWREDPAAFFLWAQSNGYRDDLTIDRIDTDKGYQPDNCRWADKFQQNNNQRSNVRIEYNGIVHTLAEWCRYLELPYSHMSYYIRQRGVEFSEAVKKTVEKCHELNKPVPDDVLERLAMIGEPDSEPIEPPPPEAIARVFDEEEKDKAVKRL